MGRVTNCTKSNTLNCSMVFWDTVFDDDAEDFPEVGTDNCEAAVGARRVGLWRLIDHPPRDG